MSIVEILYQLTIHPMKWYWKMLRRLVSHPSFGLELARKFQKTHIWWGERCCLKCWVIWGQHIHKTAKTWVRSYKCTHCKKIYSEFYGTIFYRSKVPIHKWMILILEWSISTWSISAAEAGRKLEIQHSTAWNMILKIWTLFESCNNSQLLSWIVEADEAWMWKKKNNNQDIILWMVERWERKLHLYPVENVKEESLYPHIKANVEYGSKFFTDSRVSYSATCVYYQHWTTNHSKSEYSKWEIHSNTIEQIWGDIKGIIRTIHHWVSKKYRQLYLALYTAKYENIKHNDLFYFTLDKILRPPCSII